MKDLASVAEFSPAERKVMQTMLRSSVNAPRTTSAGRLFDGFAALSGLRQRTSYEGQTAMEFEWAADGVAAGQPYGFPLIPGPAKDSPWIVDWQPALESLLADRRRGVPAGVLSAAFHDGLAAALVAAAQRIGEPRVILTGGCFQNARLTETSVAALRAAGHEPIWHRRVPPNDGGIALGQAAWAAWQMSGRIASHEDLGETV
jgi:hydrogenase maturation protein HypF